MMMWWVTQLYILLILKVCSQSSVSCFQNGPLVGNSEESSAVTHHVHCGWLRQIISACNGHELCIHMTQHSRGCPCIQFQWQLLHTEDHRYDLAMLKTDKMFVLHCDYSRSKYCKKKSFTVILMSFKLNINV